MRHSFVLHAITRCLSCILKKVRVKNSQKPVSIKLCKNFIFHRQYSWRITIIQDLLKDFEQKTYNFLKREYDMGYSNVVYAITRCLRSILKKVRVKNSEKSGSIKLCKNFMFLGQAR